MRTLMAVAAFAAAVVSAQAADLNGGSLKDAPPVYETPTWSGFYLGVLGGVSANRTNLTGYGPSAYYPGGYVSLETDFPASPNGSNTSSVFGIEVGHDWQLGRYVLGVGTDFNFTGASHRSGTAYNDGGTPYSDTDTISSKADYFWTVRARAGVLFQPNMMVYGTGGLALTHFKGGYWDSEMLSSDKTSGDIWGVGWTAGAGIEYRFYEHWVARAEYLHVSTSASLSTTNDSESEAYAVKTSLDQDIARFGLLYKF